MLKLNTTEYGTICVCCCVLCVSTIPPFYKINLTVLACSLRQCGLLVLSGVFLLQLFLLQLVVVGASKLHHLRHAHKEIYSKQAIILWYNNHRVTGPNNASGSQCTAACYGNCVCRSRQITEASDNKTLGMKKV